MNFPTIRNKFIKFLFFIQGNGSLEEKYFHTLSFFNVPALILVSISNYFFDLGTILISGTFLYSIFSGFVFYFSRLHKKKYDLKLMYAFSGLALFGFLWIYNGGIDGGAGYVLFIILGTYIVVLNRKESLILVFFSVLTVTCLIGLDFYFPEVITRYRTVEDRYIDIAISILITISVNIFTRTTIFKNYKTFLKRSQSINKYLNRNLKRINLELDLARKVQKSFMNRTDGVFESLRFSIKFKPVSEVSGDIYFIDETETSIRFLLGDLTGHGVQAGFLTMIIFSEFQILKTQNLKPNALLEKLNLSLFEKYSRLEIYLSCVVLEIFPNENRLEFASAGHLDQYLISDKKEILNLPRTGHLLGLNRKSNYTLIETSFSNLDSIFLFTDGLTDEFAQLKNKFTIDTLSKILRKNQSSVIKEIVKFRDAYPQDDDITMIEIQHLQNIGKVNRAENI
jgi:hypothetical protein